MENLNNWIIATNDFIWTYILIALLICIGVYFTFKSKFVQFRNIREMFRLLGDGISKREPQEFGFFFSSILHCNRFAGRHR